MSTVTRIMLEAEAAQRQGGHEGSNAGGKVACGNAGSGSSGRFATGARTSGTWAR